MNETIGKWWCVLGSQPEEEKKKTQKMLSGGRERRNRDWVLTWQLMKCKWSHDGWVDWRNFCVSIPFANQKTHSNIRTNFSFSEIHLPLRRQSNAQHREKNERNEMRIAVTIPELVAAGEKKNSTKLFFWRSPNFGFLCTRAPMELRMFFALMILPFLFST